MRYTDVRCSRCGTWQTALVGYDGSQICLTCGEMAGRGGDATAMVPLSELAWLAESWTASAGLSGEQRRTRLRAWLSSRDIALSEELVEVLAHCDSAAEVRFALPIVTLSTWRVVGERTVTDGSWHLRVQQPVGGERADFVLSGSDLPRALVIEIDDPRNAAPEQRRAAHLRTLELQAAGYLVLRVPAGDAAERGRTLRRAFYREALELEHRATAADTAVEAARAGRIWHPHELVYDAHDLPLEQRRELVEDWLRSRGVALQAWQYDFLAHCHRAGEVHFALPFLLLPSAEPADDRTVHLDPWHTLRAQVRIDDHTVDFHFMTVLDEGGPVASALVEIHPARGAPDLAAERARRERWEAGGLHVVEIPAAEARARGQQWAASLRREVEWRRDQEAG